jgi:hypothetical protein
MAFGSMNPIVKKKTLASNNLPIPSVFVVLLLLYILI